MPTSPLENFLADTPNLSDGEYSPTIDSTQPDPYGVGTEEEKESSRPMPIPRRQQPYMMTRGQKSPQEWGQPDYILQGAQRYPGLSPAPYMPQLRDARELVQRNSKFFIQNGSILSRLLAGQMLHHNNKYWEDLAKGKQVAAKEAHDQYKFQQEKLVANNDREFRLLADAFSAYKDDPEKLKAQLLRLTYQFDDPVLRDVVQTQGIERAEQMISERHNNNLDQLKIIHQRLQNDDLMNKTREAERHQKLIDELFSSPSQTQLEQQRANAPIQGTDPTTGIANSPSPASPLISTDPGVAPGSGTAPAYSWWAKPTAQTAAPAPTAPLPEADRPTVPEGGFPAGVTAQNAANRRGELVDWANKNGVALPPPDTAGLANWVATHQPTPSAPAPAGGAATQSNQPPPARLLAGYDPATLDKLAWTYLESKQLPHTQSGGRDFSLFFNAQNKAVQDRAYQLDQWLDQLLNTIPPPPPDAANTTTGKRDQIAKAEQALKILRNVEPGLANRLGAILRGDQPMPAGGFGGNSPFGQKMNQLIMRLDPTYSQARFRNNDATTRYWTSGQGRVRLSGFKQAILHAETLLRVSEGMPNTRFRDINALVNEVQRRAGLPPTTEWDSIFGHFTQELTRAFRGSAGALGDINREHGIVNSNASPEQMRQYIRATVELLDGALRNMADDWNAGTMQNLRGTDMINDPQIIAALARIKQIPLSTVTQSRLGSPPVYDHNNPDPQADPRDASMVTWLKTHPNDPRAAVMRDMLNAKGLL